MSKIHSFLFSAILSAVIALPIAAQPRLTPANETVNLGQVQWKSSLTFENTITNTGDKPLVLTMVTTSCECTAADWTKDPIPPGGQGSITATFDATMLGHFDKSIGIYSNADPQLQYFYFAGEVVEKVTDFSRTHPFDFDGIRLDDEEIAFPDVHRGSRSEVRLSVANQSDTTYTPVLMHLPSYVTQEAIPPTLEPGEQGIIRLTLDADRLTDFGLAQATVYISRFEGDKVGDDNEIPLSAVLLPELAATTNPPIIRLSDTEIDLGEALANKKKASYNVTVSNEGASPLTIAKLQVFNPAVEVSLRKSTLKPGEKTRLRITLHKENLNRRRRLHILLITNDPKQPKVTLNIRAQITDGTSRE
jgi:hypothetical protein